MSAPTSTLTGSSWKKDDNQENYSGYNNDKSDDKNKDDSDGWHSNYNNSNYNKGHGDDDKDRDDADTP